MFGWFSEETYSYDSDDKISSFTDVMCNNIGIENNTLSTYENKQINKQIDRLQSENHKMNENMKNLFDKVKQINLEIKKSKEDVDAKINKLDLRIQTLETKINSYILVDPE